MRENEIQSEKVWEKLNETTLRWSFFIHYLWNRSLPLHHQSEIGLLWHLEKPQSVTPPHSKIILRTVSKGTNFYFHHSSCHVQNRTFLRGGTHWEGGHPLSPVFQQGLLRSRSVYSWESLPRVRRMGGLAGGSLPGAVGNSSDCSNNSRHKEVVHCLLGTVPCIDCTSSWRKSWGCYTSHTPSHGYWALLHLETVIGDLVKGLSYFVTLFRILCLFINGISHSSKKFINLMTSHTINTSRPSLKIWLLHIYLLKRPFFSKIKNENLIDYQYNMT